MSEILRPNFGKTKPSLISPFNKEGPLKGNFTGESKFSKNGVVEYVTGVKPKDDVSVLSRVRLHVGPMERTILSAFPDKKERGEIDPLTKEHLSSLSHLALVNLIDGSTPQDWVDEADEYLNLIAEVRDRELDESEDLN